MADLVVTFSSARNLRGLPLAHGRSTRTEAIEIGVASVESTLSALPNEHFVEVVAGAACWIEIGPSPTAAVVTSGSSPPTGTSRMLLADSRYEFSVFEGDQIAVIGA